MTDFSEWSQESLASLASEFHEENKVLRKQVRDLLAALRKEWLKQESTNADVQKSD